MPLTPPDVAQVVFSKPPLGKRGYHEEEVDAFLDIVQAELTRLIQHNDDLRTRIDHLEQQLTNKPADPAGDCPSAQLPAPQTSTIRVQRRASLTLDNGPHVRAAKVLTLAQQMVDKITSQTHAEVEEMLNQADSTVQQLLAEAKAQADDLVTQAHTQTQTLLAQAHSRAEVVDQQARDKAAALERQATRQHTEILAPLRQEKSALDKQIDQLRAFDQDRRTRLTTYLQSQLRQLNQSGSLAAPDTIHQPADPVPAGSDARTAAASPT